MSDVMRGMPPGGGMGGMGGAPQGGMDVRNKMSMMNPTDMAAKVSRGDVRAQQTVGDFLQKNYGVSPQDPVEKLFAAVKSQAQNATVPGKMGMQQTPQATPQARPQMPGAMPGAGAQRAPTNMDELVGRMS